jgi:hypothetical protein
MAVNSVEVQYSDDEKMSDKESMDDDLEKNGELFSYTCFSQGFNIRKPLNSWCCNSEFNFQVEHVVA